MQDEINEKKGHPLLSVKIFMGVLFSVIFSVVEYAPPAGRNYQPLCLGDRPFSG